MARLPYKFNSLEYHQISKDRSAWDRWHMYHDPEGLVINTVGPPDGTPEFRAAEHKNIFVSLEIKRKEYRKACLEEAAHNVPLGRGYTRKSLAMDLERTVRQKLLKAETDLPVTLDEVKALRSSHPKHQDWFVTGNSQTNPFPDTKNTITGPRSNPITKPSRKN